MNTQTSHATEYSWLKVLMWSFLFYFAWHGKSMLLVYNEGILPGPDDFLRLHQVQNWLSGQGWYDLTAYRMFPSVGADIHWSRFVDIPIGALISFFNIFTDTVTASRIASIVWPLALFLSSVALIVAISDNLIGKQHRLFALFFFVLSVDTMVEFKPGRLDHHNVQIVLLILMIFGICKGFGKYSSYFVGAIIPLTLVIGLDSVVCIFAALSFLAFDWALNREGAAKRLKETGLAIGISSPIFYALSFTPENWLSNNACDAYSSFYVAALVLLSIGFVFLAKASVINIFGAKNTLVFRLLLGIAVAGTIIIVIFYIFPNCLEGPLGNISPELQVRWLDSVLEAKGLFERMQIDLSYWGAQAIYLSIVLGVAIWVVIKRAIKTPELAVLGFIIVICILGTLYQTRIIRTGIYIIIPFCVIFANMTWVYLSNKFKNNIMICYVAQASICLALTPFFWIAIGFIISSILPNNTAIAQVGTNNKINSLSQISCTSEIAVNVLKDTKSGHVISDLNTSTALLVHTNHTVEGGSYHRNSESILNVLNFFQGSFEEAKEIADKSDADFVVICRDNIPPQSDNAKSILVNAIATNQLPEWLKLISKPEAKLVILKVVH